MKTVMITGATSGFGHGLTRRFLEGGYRVIATGRKLRSRENVLLSERNEFPQHLVELDLDVTSGSDREAIAEYFSKNPLDVLINNAGFGVFEAIEDCTEDQMRKQFEVNVFGLMLLTQKLLPALRQTKGSIFNFSSVFGFTGFPFSGLYCASKFAVEGFSESLSYEMQPFGVKVILIEPGRFNTNFNSSVEWRDEANKSPSVYRERIQNYARIREKLANQSDPPHPRKVIDGVYRIAQLKRPKLRYVFGNDAYWTGVLRKFLSSEAYHRISGAVISRALTKGL